MRSDLGLAATSAGLPRRPGIAYALKICNPTRKSSSSGSTTLPRFPEQIKSGHYDDVNKHFTPKHFQPTLDGKRTVVLFDPKGLIAVSFEEMTNRMKAAGASFPPSLDDALAMGTQFPNRQKRNPIVFLQELSFAARTDLIVFLHSLGWNNTRRLDLIWTGINWRFRYDFRFAAVRES